MQTTEKSRQVDTAVFHRGSLGCHQANPRCVDQHFVVRWIIGITHRASQKAPQEPTIKCGSSMTRSTRVALRDPRGVSIIPLTKLLRSLAQSSCEL
jgi:hypothetical protein